MSVYANAADVLPSELLKAVQKHWRGLLYGYLYLFKDKLRYGWQKKEYRSIYSYEQYWRRTC